MRERNGGGPTTVTESPHASTSHSRIASRPDPGEPSPEIHADDDSRRRTTSSPNNTANDDREATELSEIADRDHGLSSPSTVSFSSEDYHMGSQQTISQPRSAQSGVQQPENSIFATVSKFWTHHVSLVVPHKKNRDYFALERTFLAYIRTSLTFSIQGVMVAQLFRLQTTPPSPSPPSTANSQFDFYSVGIPLATAYHGCAIVVAALGAHRFWRQQNAIAREKVYAGGWEMNAIGLLSILSNVVLFALAIALIVTLD